MSNTSTVDFTNASGGSAAPRIAANAEISIATQKDTFIRISAPRSDPDGRLAAPGSALLVDLILDRTKKEAGRVLTFGIDAFNDLNHVNDTAYIGTLTSPLMSRVAVA